MLKKGFQLGQRKTSFARFLSERHTKISVKYIKVYYVSTNIPSYLVMNLVRIIYVINNFHLIYF
jgi:hypothetical protein